MVYVLDINSKPLMPCTEAKARHLLRAGNAVIVRSNPFTIKLTFTVSGYTEPVTLGVDTGSANIGLSATTETKVLFESEVLLREDISVLLTSRREKRRSRRNRTTRYREPRFDNRVRSKNKEWLAPSVENKISTHLRVIEFACSILPISKIIIEVAQFDIQKIKNPNIEGVGYQQGEQLGFWNTREYVLWRDNHICQHCHGKSKDKVLNVHHIVARKDGGSDRPENLITLCKTCHKAYHKKAFKLEIKKTTNFKHEAFMGIMRWTVYNRLKEKYGEKVSLITKNTRIRHNMEKSHMVDARCISSHPEAVQSTEWYQITKRRCHNRQIHKETILKGGIRKANQCSKLIYGFRLFDKVLTNGITGYIHSRRTSGYFDMRMMDGTVISHGVSYRNLTLVERTKTLTIWRMATPLLSRAEGVSVAKE